MGEVNTFDRYVRHRLDEWGREFCLARDMEFLGHKSKDMLQVLIEHKGEMPPRVTGFKPLHIPPRVMEIEDIVTWIAKDALILAWVLRAYYCGSGRRGEERYALAQQLARRNFSRKAFFTYHTHGFQRVAGMLLAVARNRAEAA